MKKVRIADINGHTDDGIEISILCSGDCVFVDRMDFIPRAGGSG